jgi:small subunit ribosomal protein S20
MGAILVCLPCRARLSGPASRAGRCYRRSLLLANIKSQIKRNRQNERRRVRNKAAKSEIKTRVKVAVRAAEEGAEHAPEALRVAMKRIDKAAAKGIIHKHQASNRKSRLMKRLAKVSS